MFHTTRQIARLLLLVSAVLLAACGRSDLLPNRGKGGADASQAGGSGLLGHPWPVFGRDPQGTRRSPVDTSGNTGKLRWRLELGPGQKSSPVVSQDGTVYVYSDDRTLYAVAPPTTGTVAVLKWRYTAAGTDGGVDLHWVDSPAIDTDGTVYVATSDTVFAVSAPAGGTNGLLKWSYQSPERFDSLGSPTVGGDGMVFVLGAQLLALDPQGSGSLGVLKWSSTVSWGIMDPPAIASDGTIYYGPGELESVKPPTLGTNGTLAWSFPDAHVQTSPAIAADGTVFVGGDNLRVNAISPAAGGAGPTLKWSYRTGCIGHSAPAIGPDGTVYVAGYDWDLFAFNPDVNGNGEVLKWRWYHQGEHGLSSSSSPAVGADGTIYVAGQGNLYAIRPPASGGDGVLNWVFQTEGTEVSAPAIGADGTVYVTADDTLYAIQ